jgi:hypothetical protein
MNLEGLIAYFTREKVVRNCVIAFIYLIAGTLALIACYILSSIFSKGSGLHYFMQNAGYVLLFIAIGLMYAAIHRGNSGEGPHAALSLSLHAARKAHVIGAGLLGSILILFIAALAQALFSFIGLIPYAGPAIVSLMTLPMFLVNFAGLLLVILAWVLVPPLVSDGVDARRLFQEFLDLVKRRGVSVIAYTFASLVAAVAVFAPILMVVRYAAGITRAVQWNIAPAYPKSFMPLIRPSYVTDVLGALMPRTDPLAAFQKYGTSIFNYVELLGVVLKIAYGIVIVALAASVLSLFLNLLSYWYGRIRQSR